MSVRLLILVIAALALAACEISTQGPVGDQYAFNDGTPYYLENMQWRAPADGGPIALAITARPGDPEIGPAELPEFADRLFYAAIGGTANKYGFESAIITVRPMRRAGINVGTPTTVERRYYRDLSGVWLPIEHDTTPPPVTILREERFDLDGRSLTLNVVHDGQGYIFAARRLGRLVSIDCVECDDDLETQTRIAYRLLREYVTETDRFDDETLVGLRVQGRPRQNEGEIVISATFYLERVDTEGDWPVDQLSEDHVLRFFASQAEQDLLRGEQWRAQAEASRRHTAD